MVETESKGSGAVAGLSDGRASASAPSPASAPVPEYQDIDSEELEALEDLADEEDDDDDAIERLLDEAALEFPPDTVVQMVKELKQDGMVSFLHKFVVPRPGYIKKLLVALGVFLPKSMRDSPDVSDQMLLPILKTALSRILRQRERLHEYNTVDDAVELIRRSRKIIVLSGAGISVSCGIPDFRSKDGIYATLQREGKFDLDDPQDMFDKQYFLHNPSCFYSFAHSIFPSNFTPSASHRFIKHLETSGQLLRNYSQNIDTLEQIAGIERVLQCHGSFASATCTDPSCGYKAPGSSIKEDIFAQRVPSCPRCEERRAKGRKRRRASSDSEDDYGLAMGIMKPDITFFGEKLSDAFDHALLADRDQVDLLIVMGTSLKVAPVSELVAHIPHSTPVILINRTPIYHIAMDIMLLGDADRVVEYLCSRLNVTLPAPAPDKAAVGDVRVDQPKTKPTPEKQVKEPERLLDSHVWLFEGAEPGRLVELLTQGDTDSEDEQEPSVDAQHEAEPPVANGSTSAHEDAAPEEQEHKDITESRKRDK